MSYTYGLCSNDIEWRSLDLYFEGCTYDDAQGSPDNCYCNAHIYSGSGWILGHDLNSNSVSYVGSS